MGLRTGGMRWRAWAAPLTSPDLLSPLGSALALFLLTPAPSLTPTPATSCSPLLSSL